MKTQKTTIVIIILLVINIMGQFHNYDKLKVLENDLSNIKHEINQMNVHLPNRISHNIESIVEKQNNIFLSIKQSKDNYNFKDLTYDVTFTLVPKKISETGEVFIVIDGKTYPTQKQATSYVAVITLDMVKDYNSQAIIRDNGNDFISESDDLCIEADQTKIFPFKFDFSYRTIGSNDDYRTLNYNLQITTLDKLDQFKKILLVAEQNKEIVSEQEVVFKSDNSSQIEMFDLEYLYKFNDKTEGEIVYKLIAIDNNNYRYEAMVSKMTKTRRDNGGIGISSTETVTPFNGDDIIIKNPQGEIIYESID